MRTITLTTLLQLLISLPLFAQEEWVIQESPVNIDLYSVDFINSNKGIAVGALSTILITNDGGQNWQSISTNFSEVLLGVSYYDELHAVAVGTGGLIIVTEDGGTTWTSHQLPEMLWKLCSVDITNDGKGVACGEQGALLYTSDGGINWSVIQQNETGCLNSVRRVNDSLTYLFGTSGGAQFNQIQVMLNDSITDTYSFYVNYQSNDWNGVLYDGYAFNDTSVVTAGSINLNSNFVGAITVNQELKNPVWESCFTMENIEFFGVDFIENHGVAVGGAADFQPEKSIIIESSDSGASWMKAFETETVSKFRDVKAIGNVAYVVGNNGTIMKKEIETHSESISPNKNNLMIFPNPSSDFNEIKFTLETPGNVNIAVYDLNGRCITLPFAGYLNAGEHQILNPLSSISGTHLTPGIYIVKLVTDKMTSSTKMIIQ